MVSVGLPQQDPLPRPSACRTGHLLQLQGKERPQTPSRKEHRLSVRLRTPQKGDHLEGGPEVEDQSRV